MRKQTSRRVQILLYILKKSIYDEEASGVEKKKLVLLICDHVAPSLCNIIAIMQIKIATL